MNIVSLKPEAAGAFAKDEAVYRIELSDGSLFSFRNCYLPQNLQDPRLYDPSSSSGKEISADEEAAFRNASACLRAEKAALRLIARAEQYTAGLSRKLEKRGHERICVNAAISRLSALRLLDDSRFARLWLESRLRLARSPRRLFVSLRARGIDCDDAEAALKNVLDEEAELSMIARFAKKLAHFAKKRTRKAGGGEGVTRSLKSLLKSEGFSYTAIQGYLGKDE